MVPKYPKKKSLLAEEAIQFDRINYQSPYMQSLIANPCFYDAVQKEDNEKENGISTSCQDQHIFYENLQNSVSKNKPLMV
jgi:hypothetical protein